MLFLLEGQQGSPLSKIKNNYDRKFTEYIFQIQNPLNCNLGVLEYWSNGKNYPILQYSKSPLLVLMG
jgi:hypothetical protein